MESMQGKPSKVIIPPNPMDPFDRQRRIEGWNQDKLEKEVCLLLGTGGLGCSVAMGLARLGVGKLILLDKDVVDISNLNRQMLFDHGDIGSSKVLAAASKLKRDHLINTNTVIEAYDMCALQNWQKIVELSAEATVVFNMIDVGDYFDAAVSSLCMQRQIPLIQGGTFSQSYTVDIFRPMEACVACSDDNLDKAILEQLLPSMIESVPDLTFIPKNNNPIGQSNAYLCIICAMMMISRYSTCLIGDPEVEVHPRFIMTVNSGEAFQFPIAAEPKCPFCKDWKLAHGIVDEEPPAAVITSNEEAKEEENIKDKKDVEVADATENIEHKSDSAVEEQNTTPIEVHQEGSVSQPIVDQAQ